MEIKTIEAAKEFLASRGITSVETGSFAHRDGECQAREGSIPIADFSDTDIIVIANGQIAVDAMNGESE